MKELERCAIDPGEIASSISARRRSGTANASKSRAIEAAIEQLRSMADGRRNIFFNIGLLYALEGRSPAEVESALREVAGSDARLLAKVPDVNQSLRRYGRLTN